MSFKLIEAVTLNDVEGVLFCILSGINPNIKNVDKMSLLSLAAARPEIRIEIIRLLLEGGAEVDSRDRCDVTPLHYASRIGRNDVVNLLISYGADVNAKDAHDITALHLASFNGHVEIVKTLLEHGADVNTKDAIGDTPLHSGSAHLEVIKLLLERGAYTNVKNGEGLTPLEHYRRHGLSNNSENPEIIKLLSQGVGFEFNLNQFEHFIQSMTFH